MFELMSQSELLDRVQAELIDCTTDLAEFFTHSSIPPTRWHLSPWADPIGGFWVIATYENRALWFNEIEDGFNVSTYTQEGEIPSDQYWCNQDELRWALPLLRSGGGTRLGPPEPPGNS